MAKRKESIQIVTSSLFKKEKKTKTTNIPPSKMITTTNNQTSVPLMKQVLKSSRTLKLKLTFEVPGFLHDLYFLDVIQRALKVSYGLSGTSTDIEMLHFLEDEGVAFIRVDQGYQRYKIIHLYLFVNFFSFSINHQPS